MTAIRFKATVTTRRLHRLLGVSAGIQLLLWVVSGLYFSWVDLDKVHGDPQKKPPVPLLADTGDLLCSPAIVLANLKREEGEVEVRELRLINVLQKNYWQIVFVTPFGSDKKYRLAEAHTGRLRPPALRG